MGTSPAHAQIAATYRPDWVEQTVAAALVLLAVWTVAVHASVVFGLTFATLVRFSPGVIALALAVWLWWRRPDHTRGAGEQPDLERHESVGLGWLVPAVVIVIVFAITRQFVLYWVAGSLYLLAALWRLRRSRGEWAPYAAGGKLWPILAAVFVASTITLLGHRPDADDAFYVGLAADAVALPELPVLDHDVVYPDPHLPLPLPVYKLASYELLTALVARLADAEPITIAHLWFPPIAAALTVLGWVLLCRVLAPERWGVLVLLMVLLAMALGEAHRSPGNLAFVRLHQGKAVFATAIAPVILAYAWRFASRGGVRDWVLLALAVIAGLGATSSGLVLGPAIAMLGIISGCVPVAPRRLVAGAGVLLYPLAAGVSLYTATASRMAQEHLATPELGAEIAQSLGTWQQYPLLLGLLAGWIGASAVGARALGLIGFLSLLGPLNPFLTGWISRHITSDATFWRVIWTVPWLVLLALLLDRVASAATFRFRRAGLRGSIWGFVVVVGVSILVRMGSVFSPSNGLQLRRPGLNVEREPYRTARVIVERAPKDRPVLAPESVAIWVATASHRPPLLVVRSMYLHAIGRAYGEEEQRRRERLLALVTGQPIEDPEGALMAAIRHDRLGAVAFVANADLGGALAKVLSENGFVAVRGSPFVVWVLERSH